MVRAQKLVPPTKTPKQQNSQKQLQASKQTNMDKWLKRPVTVTPDSGEGSGQPYKVYHLMQKFAPCKLPLTVQQPNCSLQ